MYTQLEYCIVIFVVKPKVLKDSINKLKNMLMKQINTDAHLLVGQHKVSCNQSDQLRQGSQAVVYFNDFQILNTIV